MQRKRYETDLDKVQAQAVQRARAGMHPDVVAARERPSPIEQQTGGVEAPAETQQIAAERRPVSGQGRQGLLQQLAESKGTAGRLMRGRQSPADIAQQSEGLPGLRERVLAEMQRRRGNRGRLAA